KKSPYRERSVEENMDLFLKMRRGEFENGSRVLRAKIDMSSPNVNLRDPVMYRVLHAPHHRTGKEWPIYPMYDWAHGIEDSIERVTHSLCTLEFESHRPLYDWFLEKLHIHHPRQIEFERLNLTHTVLSKRHLLNLVLKNVVSGWADPRMPTLAGLRRRGYTPASIKDFCNRIGVSKSNSTVETALLEHCLREDLNKNAPRFMGVLKPLRVVIENYPENKTEYIEALCNPADPKSTMRKVPFSKELFIEQDDFMENPPKKFFRLTKGREVRLRYAYFITCTDVIKDESGNVVELRCTYDPETKGGDSPDGRKVKATLHWVSKKHAVFSEIRLFESLFLDENPMPQKDGEETELTVNPNSMTVLQRCPVEPHIKELNAGDQFQFERLGYFCVETADEKSVLNRAVTLRDTWAKVSKKK
ncbi:MAG: glutamine--tRNA ligase, partial [Nitrospinota bacterium]